MLRPYFLFLILLMAATAFAQTDSIPTENSGKVAVIVELGKETSKTSKTKVKKTKDKAAKDLASSAKSKKNKREKELVNKNKGHETNNNVEAALTGVNTSPDQTKLTRNQRPSENCALAYDVIDEFSGKRKRALKPRAFFGFTPESYEKFFPDQDFLQCEGHLVESDGQLALRLRIIIQDKSAKKQFGTIEPGAQVFIRPMKSSTLALSSYAGATVSEENDKTVYDCSFALDKSALKVLKNDEIDTIRIIWSKGYQTYQVYYLDFLRDQFSCFDEL